MEKTSELQLFNFCPSFNSDLSNTIDLFITHYRFSKEDEVVVNSFSVELVPLLDALRSPC